MQSTQSHKQQVVQRTLNRRSRISLRRTRSWRLSVTPLLLCEGGLACLHPAFHLSKIVSNTSNGVWFIHGLQWQLQIVIS